MRKNFNKILKGISVADVQIDNFDDGSSAFSENKVAGETNKIEPLTSEIKEINSTADTIPKVVTKKRGRKKKEETNPKICGRRFRGKDYTSTRIRKDHMALLRILFEENTSVEIMDFLISQYLEQNQKLLARKVAGVKSKA